MSNSSLPIFSAFLCKKEGGNLQAGLGCHPAWLCARACVCHGGVLWRAATGNSEDAAERQILTNLAAATSYSSSKVAVVALLHLLLCLVIKEVSKDSSLLYFWAENLFWWLVPISRIPMAHIPSYFSLHDTSSLIIKSRHLAAHALGGGVNPSCLLWGRQLWSHCLSLIPSKCII